MSVTSGTLVTRLRERIQKAEAFSNQVHVERDARGTVHLKMTREFDNGYYDSPDSRFFYSLQQVATECGYITRRVNNKLFALIPEE